MVVTGRKTWLVRYRTNGKHRRMKLGTYPALSLADAREGARSDQARAGAGADPAADQPERRGTYTALAAMARDVGTPRAAAPAG